MIRQCLVLGCLLATALACATEIPTPTRYDERITETDYFDRNVYRIATFYGMHVQIVLNKDEDIKPEWIKFGDPMAWEPSVIGNRVFIKAIAEKPDTNMSIITSKREYEFVLEAKPASSIDDKGAVLKVIFNYPVDDFQQRNQTDLAGLELASARRNEQNRPFNRRYEWQGDEQLKPLEVKDDGQRTYFRFARQKELPLVYAIGPDDREIQVNYAIDGEYLVVQRLAGGFAIRYANLVASIRNTAYEGIQRTVGGQRGSSY